MREFVDCTHPNLPGVVATLATPFGEWAPIRESSKPVKVSDLREFAKAQGIDVSGAKTKADVVKAIDTARSEQAEKDSPTAGDNPKE